jgi:hypothetical protein
MIHSLIKSLCVEAFLFKEIGILNIYIYIYNLHYVGFLCCAFNCKVEFPKSWLNLNLKSKFEH